MCSYKLECTEVIDHVDLLLDDISLNLKISDLEFNKHLQLRSRVDAGHLDELKLSRDGVSIFRCLRLDARVGVKTYSRRVVRSSELVDIMNDIIDQLVQSHQTLGWQTSEICRLNGGSAEVELAHAGNDQESVGCSLHETQLVIAEFDAVQASRA